MNNRDNFNRHYESINFYIFNTFTMVFISYYLSKSVGIFDKHGNTHKINADWCIFALKTEINSKYLLFPDTIFNNVYFQMYKELLKPNLW